MNQFVVSKASFVSSRYEGSEGDTIRVCANITKPIAKSASVGLSLFEVSGLSLSEGNAQYIDCGVLNLIFVYS